MRSLSDSEIELLKSLYVMCDVPVDSFISNWDQLVQLAADFNRQVGGSFKPEELLNLMMRQRKRGRWPRIRRQYHGRQNKRAS